MSRPSELHVELFDREGHSLGSILASRHCRTVDNHQNCSSQFCECPCHENSKLGTSGSHTEFWPAKEETTHG